MLALKGRETSPFPWNRVLALIRAIGSVRALTAAAIRVALARRSISFGLTPCWRKILLPCAPPFSAKVTASPAKPSNFRSRPCSPVHFPSSPSKTIKRNLGGRSEEHTSELQSHLNLVCRLL